MVCPVLVITASDAQWLTSFGLGLLEDRLCAAVYQIDRIQSMRRVEEEIRSQAQRSITVHSRTSLVEAIAERVTREHPDDLPCVVALPVIAADPDYGRWVAAETART
jgi:periplasmic divalent cation tolerance protein